MRFAFPNLGKNGYQRYSDRMTVEDIAWHLGESSLRWTDHIFERLLQRGIFMDDVIAALGAGEIIEQYPNDYPFPSCLVLGHDMAGRALHVVCGSDGSELWLITAYSPSPFKWAEGFRQRRK